MCALFYCTPVAASKANEVQEIFQRVAPSSSHLVQVVNGGRKGQRLGGVVQRSIVKGGVLGRTRETVTQSWFVRTNTIVTAGEEHRCSRTWKNGPRFVGVC